MWLEAPGMSHTLTQATPNGETNGRSQRAASNPNSKSMLIMSNALSSCVSSLRSSNAFLSSSISILDSGVNDFPRLAKVLQTTRVTTPLPLLFGLSFLANSYFPPSHLIGMQHFELLPTSTLSAAQASLVASITPEISSLLSRVESHLDRLERREQALIARCDLLEGRLSHGDVEGGTDKNDAGEGAREALRLKQMRGKKERLVYAVERLQMQAQQKERQLRMSVAAK